ncbi:hypothetical protein HYV49_05610 [Candidatus Pacearchaeota archaeon]|nr:hypothetical protein [Candidatus Pacearchaeota archaeon]
MEEDPRTKEELDLCKRIYALIEELKKKGDHRVVDILDVMDKSAKSVTSPENIRPVGEVLYKSSLAVFNYIEENHPDLYGFVQKTRRDLN